MDFDTFLAVTALVGAAISYAVLRFCDKNVYAKYNKTENAVPVSTKKVKQ